MHAFSVSHFCYLLYKNLGLANYLEPGPTVATNNSFPGRVVGYNRNNRTHRSLLLCLLMTSCDLSDQTKGWKTTRKIAHQINARYRLLSEIFPRATELYERVAANREQWTKVSHKFTIRGLPSNNSLDFLDQEYELLQSQGAFGSDDHCINGCLDDGDGGQGQ
ncbi:hypothetical protein CRUP_032584 [Coryphaenoides rupestris]|nr:hypothetical protein CRUP_032584 [Coryphaenoides rupestris]